MVYTDCDNAYDIIKAKPEFKKCLKSVSKYIIIDENKLAKIKRILIPY